MIYTYSSRTSVRHMWAVTTQRLIGLVVLMGLFLALGGGFTPVAAQSFVQLGNKIDGEAAGDLSGYMVAMSADGKRLAVGAPSNGGAGAKAGHVRVYELRQGAWQQLGSDLEGEAPDDGFGLSVALSADGSRLAVGAFKNDGGGRDAGHVRVFNLVAGSWRQMGSDIDGEAPGDQSGWSGGALRLRHAAGRLVHVLVMELTSKQVMCACMISEAETGNKLAVIWTGIESVINLVLLYRFRLMGSDLLSVAPLNDLFGSAAGQVKVFELEGADWAQLGAGIGIATSQAQFGYSVALSADGSRLAVGARLDLLSAGRSGSARVYELGSQAWQQVGSAISGQAENDEFGFSVAISGDGNLVVVGARFSDSAGSDAGQVSAYELTNNDWQRVGNVLSGNDEDDQLGYSVALAADSLTLAIGAPYQDGNGADAGQVSVFQLKRSSSLRDPFAANSAAAALKIYPNPSSPGAALNLAGAALGGYGPKKYTIRNVHGAVVAEGSLLEAGGLDTGRVPVDTLHAGTFVVTVSPADSLDICGRALLVVR